MFSLKSHNEPLSGIPGILFNAQQYVQSLIKKESPWKVQFRCVCPSSNSNPDVYANRLFSRFLGPARAKESSESNLYIRASRVIKQTGIGNSEEYAVAALEYLTEYIGKDIETVTYVELASDDEAHCVLLINAKHITLDDHEYEYDDEGLHDAYIYDPLMAECYNLEDLKGEIPGHNNEVPDFLLIKNLYKAVSEGSSQYTVADVDGFFRLAIAHALKWQQKACISCGEIDNLTCFNKTHVGKLTRYFKQASQLALEGSSENQLADVSSEAHNVGINALCNVESNSGSSVHENANFASKMTKFGLYASPQLQWPARDLNSLIKAAMEYVASLVDLESPWKIRYQMDSTTGATYPKAYANFLEKNYLVPARRAVRDPSNALLSTLKVIRYYRIGNCGEYSVAALDYLSYHIGDSIRSISLVSLDSRKYEHAILVINAKHKKHDDGRLSYDEDVLRDAVIYDPLMADAFTLTDLEDNIPEHDKGVEDFTLVHKLYVCLHNGNSDYDRKQLNNFFRHAVVHSLLGYNKNANACGHIALLSYFDASNVRQLRDILRDNNRAFLRLSCPRHIIGESGKSGEITKVSQLLPKLKDYWAEADDECNSNEHLDCGLQYKKAM